MSLQEISAQVTKGTRANVPYTVKYDVPETVNEAITRYGEEIVYSRFAASFVIDLQAFMRGQIQKDEATPESVQLAVTEWKPGMKKRGKSVVEKLQDMLASLSDEERAALLAEFA